MTLEVSFLEHPRQVSPDWHLRQAMNWIRFDDGHQFDNVLVYCSLELRCAIERNLFETLVLMRSPLSQAEESNCRSITGLLSMMKKVDPNYRKTFIFTKAYLDVHPYPSQISITDIGYLKRKWQDLSTYCHKMLKPSESFESENRKFQKRGFNLLHEIIDYFRKKEGTQVGYLRPNSIKEPLSAVYNDFVAGSISENQMKTRLNLMMPVLGLDKFMIVRQLRNI